MSADREALPRPSITVRCVGCGAKRDVALVIGDEGPMCDTCLLPMVVVSARV
jgi:hypothetical protein